jgi:16S rRNA (uracil1498-N3)-methyltransferase
LPILAEPTPFDQFLANYTASQKLIAHCEPQEKTNIKQLAVKDDCILLIGPEGDFSTKEIELALSQNYEAIHLGPTRLRTETAGLFALSVLKKF